MKSKSPVVRAKNLLRRNLTRHSKLLTGLILNSDYDRARSTYESRSRKWGEHMRKVWAMAELRKRGNLIHTSRVACRAALAIESWLLINRPRDLEDGAELVRLTRELEPTIRLLFKHCSYFDHVTEWSGTRLWEKHKRLVADIRLCIRGLR